MRMAANPDDHRWNRSPKAALVLMSKILYVYSSESRSEGNHRLRPGNHRIL